MSAFIARFPEQHPKAPLVFLVPGAGRCHRDLLSLARQFKATFDIAVCDVPDVRFDLACSKIKPLLPKRPTILVGESLGGLICLALADLEQVIGVVALDPPSDPQATFQDYAGPHAETLRSAHFSRVLKPLRILVPERDRMFNLSAPEVSLVTSGHIIADEAPGAVVDAVRQLHYDALGR